MSFKSTIRPFLITLGLLALVMAASCEKSGNQGFAYGDLEVFGDGQKDITPVIAKVGPIEITQRDFDLRFAELSAKDQNRYTGEAGQRSFLRTMVAEAVVYREAVDSKVYLDPGIAQRLIAMRRMALVGAFKNVVLAVESKPTEAEIRQYYEDNREKFIVQGRVRAQHIETATREKAQQAYDKIMSGKGKDSLFPYVVGDFSENKTTAKSGGQVGWFNKGAVVPYVCDSPEFSTLVYDWDVGLHEPTKINGRWHVVEVLERVPTRPQTITEARDEIITLLDPILVQEKEDALVSQRIKELGVEYLGKYQPGDGRTAQELFRLGVMAKNIQKQEDFLLQVANEFPDSEYAPKALFMLANAFMDNYSDKRNARINLYRLITDYPDCELYGDAKYMMDNLNKAEFANPKTIEELRGE